MANQLGLHHRTGVVLQMGLLQTHELAAPQAEQAVAPRLGLEVGFLILRELCLEGVLAVVEGGHDRNAFPCGVQ